MKKEDASPKAIKPLTLIVCVNYDITWGNTTFRKGTRHTGDSRYKICYGWLYGNSRGEYSGAVGIGADEADCGAGAVGLVHVTVPVKLFL